MPNSPYWSHFSDLQKATFKRLSLSRNQLVVVAEYYRLANKSCLSASDTYQLASLWSHAEQDRELVTALALIDDLISPCLDNRQLLSENKNLRAYLSEYIAVLAEEKLKHFKGIQEELDADASYVKFLCPDRSGIAYMKIQNGRFINLSEIGTANQQICSLCNQPFSKHERFLSIEGHSPQPKARNT